MTDKRLMCGLVGMNPLYVLRCTMAEDGPGLSELQPLSSRNVVQLNALSKKRILRNFSFHNSKQISNLLRNGKCFWFELAGLLGLAEKLIKSLTLSELVKSSGPLLLKSSGGGIGLIFLMVCFMQWLFITVGVDSSGSHLDTLPSTAPLSIWAAIFY
jgi:hypothetical protein